VIRGTGSPASTGRRVPRPAHRGPRPARYPAVLPSRRSRRVGSPGVLGEPGTSPWSTLLTVSCAVSSLRHANGRWRKLVRTWRPLPSKESCRRPRPHVPAVLLHPGHRPAGPAGSRPSRPAGRSSRPSPPGVAIIARSSGTATWSSCCCRGSGPLLSRVRSSASSPTTAGPAGPRCAPGPPASGSSPASGQGRLGPQRVSTSSDVPRTRPEDEPATGVLRSTRARTGAARTPAPDLVGAPAEGTVPDLVVPHRPDIADGAVEALVGPVLHPGHRRRWNAPAPPEARTPPCGRAVHRPVGVTALLQHLSPSAAASPRPRETGGTGLRPDASGRLPATATPVPRAVLCTPCAGPCPSSPLEVPSSPLEVERARSTSRTGLVSIGRAQRRSSPFDSPCTSTAIQ
jgi:hypothetical protein